MDSTDQTGLATRVEARMLELGLNRTKLDKMAGLATGFTRDLVAGRKEQPRIDNIERLATALQCSVNYLLHGKPDFETRDEVMLVGYCDADAWRSDGKAVEPKKSGCAPDPRFARQYQVAYEIRDGHAAENGVSQGEVVIALSAEGMAIVGITPGYGDLVVSTERNNGLSQTTIRLLSGPNPDIEIDGLVLEAVRRFRHG